MKNLVHRINRILAGFAGWLMIAMMLLLVVDIVGRAVDMPLQLMAELSVFVMMIVIYLGFRVARSTASMSAWRSSPTISRREAAR